MILMTVLLDTSTLHYILGVCVCIVIPFNLDVRLVDAPASVTQEEGHTGFLIHLPSAVLALKGFSRHFPSSTVKSIFVYLPNKNPSSCDCTGNRTHVPTQGFEVTN